MALIRCPECQREVSVKAPACPGCGYPMPGMGTPISQPPGPPAAPFPGMRRWGQPYSYEYKSSKTIFGMPLDHGPGAAGHGDPPAQPGRGRLPLN